MNVIVVDSSRLVLLMRGGGNSLIRNKITAEGTDEPGNTASLSWQGNG